MENYKKSRKFDKQNALKDLSVLMLSASAMAFTPFVFSQADDTAVEEVTVTGIRASLEAAADAKRDDARAIRRYRDEGWTPADVRRATGFDDAD